MSNFIYNTPASGPSNLMPLNPRRSLLPAGGPFSPRIKYLAVSAVIWTVMLSACISIWVVLFKLGTAAARIMGAI